jgi:thioredoxin-like negative regulator of GroEL
MILFKDGKVVDTTVGAKPKGQLKGWLDAKLA